MRIRLLLAAAILTVALALAVASEGEAQKPPKPGATTLKASADKVTFSQPVALTGKVKGGKQGDRGHARAPRGGPTAFVPAGTATTDANGDFSFASARPRAPSTAPPPARPATSPDTAVAVAPLVGLKVSDSTPRKGQRVRFRGTVRPQHDGTRVAIQRKRADGTWVTVRTPLLRDAGSCYSTLLQAHPDPPQRHLPHRDRGPRGPRRGRQPRADADVLARSAPGVAQLDRRAGAQHAPE